MRARTLLPLIALLGAVRLSAQQPATRQPSAYEELQTFFNDTTVAGLGARALELRLAGDKGSKVRLRFERGPRLEPDTFSVTLQRAYVNVSSVSMVRLVDPTTGYVRLEEFGERAASEVHDALKRLRGQGARGRGLGAGRRAGRQLRLDAPGHARGPHGLDECTCGMGDAAGESAPGKSAEPLPCGCAAGLDARCADRA
jgi:hypothetical protein